ncbi:MAG: ABC transporter permease, partial [Pseudomonadota bacterium]|nr:ABC transporter permease [Pseudomonadota bacterium]
MTRYLMTRLFYFFLALLVLSVVTFALNWLFPGDPLTNMSGIREGQAAYEVTLTSRSFDSTIIQQYLNYLEHIVRLDWG